MKMASSDPEIKDGFTLPVWMKTKPAKDFEPFARSPPAPEETFFYIGYPKSDLLFAKQKNQDVPNVVADHSNGITTAASYNVVKEKDWSKHTKPCQDVIHGITPINTAANSITSKPKPAGVDDGFKGEGAACGSSIVKVAQDMISSSRGTGRGFTVASPVDDDGQPDPQHYRLATRRGSKSLPTTPLQSPNASPTSRRKRNGNRYFTTPFEPVEDGSNRSWLSMALLGFKKDLTSSTSTLVEEDTIENRLHGGTLVESVENLGPAPNKNKDMPSLVNDASRIQAPKPSKPSQAFRPKPTELREMNFWSPTSM